MEVEAPRSVASTATDISLDVFGSADDGDGGAGKKQLLLPAEPQTLQWRQLSVSLKVSRKSPQRHLLNKARMREPAPARIRTRPCSHPTVPRCDR